jgi:hypothetical protein
MAVVVVLAFLRKELESPQEALWVPRPEGFNDPVIGQLGVEQVGLASEFLG